MTGKCAGLLSFLLLPDSPTISHATAEYTLQLNIVNKKFMDLQLCLDGQKCRFFTAAVNLVTARPEEAYVVVVPALLLLGIALEGG
jgi:hypothetical protein